MPELEQLPPISHEPISVVLLAHEAAGYAAGVAAGWLALLDARGDQSELIVVDDGSADRTDETLRAVEHPRLRVVVHDNHHGVGAALRTGLAAACQPLVFCAPLDPAYRPEFLAHFLEARVADSADRQIDHVHLMSGFRAGRPVPPGLRLLGGAWRLLARVVLSYPVPPLPGWLGFRRWLGGVGARLFFGVRLRDPACPVRLLRRHILRRIPIQCDGPMAQVELLAKANFLGCIFSEEVPLPVEPPPDRGEARGVIHEARLLFREPDFGPAVVEGG